MSVEKIKSDGTSNEYKIVLASEEIEEQISKYITEKAKTFKMQGFRKGHVPTDIVRKNFEHEAVEHAIRELVADACSKIVTEEKLLPASKPLYEIKNEYIHGKEVVCTLKIEQQPEFTLKDFACKLDKVEISISEEDIQNEKQRIMSERPVFDDVEGDYTVQCGDFVMYNAKCKINGVENKKHSTSSSIIVPLNKEEHNEFIKMFVGKKCNESFMWSGENGVEFDVILRSVKKRVIGLTWEDYLKRIGITLNDDNISKSIEQSAKNLIFLYYKQQLMNYISEEYDFAVPDSVRIQETNNVVNTIKQSASPAEPDYSKTKEELAEEYKDLIDKRVKFGYVINKIAQDNNIIVSEKELTQAIYSEVYSNPMQSDNIIKYYRQNPGAVNYKKASLIEQKTIQFLIDKCETNSTKTLSKAEIDKLLED